MIKRLFIILLLLNSFASQAQVHKHSLGIEMLNRTAFQFPPNFDRLFLLNYQLGLSERLRLDINGGVEYKTLSNEGFFRQYGFGAAVHRLTGSSGLFKGYGGFGAFYRNVRSLSGNHSNIIQLSIPVGLEWDLSEKNVPLLLDLEFSPNFDFYFSHSNYGTFTTLNISLGVRYILGFKGE